jgi:hypothetical protein
MRVPNITVVPGEEQVVDLAKFFVDGEKNYYIVKLASTTVADAKIANNTQLVVTGIEPGVTTATIEVHNESSQVINEQSIAITVRKTGNNGGWM